ncbi:unnamed protein product, partial [Coccothraustes coccothraustes]
AEEVRIWAGAGAPRAPFLKGRAAAGPRRASGAGVGVRWTRVGGAAPLQYRVGAEPAGTGTLP